MDQDNGGFKQQTVGPRRTRKELELQRCNLIAAPNLIFFLDAYPQESFIVNDSFEIILVNKAFEDFFCENGFGDVFGKRPGEAFGCSIIEGRNCAQCGESEGCQYCAANLTLQAGLKSGVEEYGECILLSGNGKEHFFDLSLNTTPLDVNEETYLICVLRDIAALKRKEALEKVFFHDIKNSVGSLETLLRLMVEPDNDIDIDCAESIGIAYETCCMINDEISTQRQLMEAESDSLAVCYDDIDVLAMCHKIVAQWNGFAKMYRVNLVFEASEIKELLVSDYNLLRRVISNLIKNAIEASHPGESITFHASVNTEEDTILFSISNDLVIPLHVQERMFHRSFSTKGIGRGLGVYSANLFTHNYLQGRLYFESDEEIGTIFYVKIPTHLSS